MLLLLSRFSRVRLCATPESAAHQAPPSLGFSKARTLEWVAISFSNAWKWKVKSQSEVAQSCPTPSDPMDCSPPGSSIHGIFQARVLEWGAIAFSIDLCITHVNTATVKVTNIFHIHYSQTFLHASFHPASPVNYWFAFCHYGLVCIFLVFYIKLLYSMHSCFV